MIVGHTLVQRNNQLTGSYWLLGQKWIELYQNRYGFNMQLKTCIHRLLTPDMSVYEETNLCCRR